MFATLILAAVLAQSPSSEGSYEAARLEVRDALDAIKGEVNDDNADALKRALTRLQSEHGPQLATDPDGLDERRQAYLALAYAYLLLDDLFQAEKAMDEALRIAMGKELPVEPFGPKLAELYAERKRVLEASGRASVKIDCAVPCRVLLSEQPIPGNDPVSLYLGTYRVWIEATDGSTEPMQVTIELDEDGQSERISFGEAAKASPEPLAPKLEPEPTPGPIPPTVDTGEADGARRIQPRWAELLGMGVGAGLLVAGAVILGLDNRCPNLQDATSRCAKVWDTEPAAGYSLLALGGGLLLVEGVMLTVDEVRVRKDRRDLQVGIGWTLRF